MAYFVHRDPNNKGPRAAFIEVAPRTPTHLVNGPLCVLVGAEEWGQLVEALGLPASNGDGTPPMHEVLERLRHRRGT